MNLDFVADDNEHSESWTSIDTNNEINDDGDIGGDVAEDNSTKAVIIGSSGVEVKVIPSKGVSCKLSKPKKINEGYKIVDVFMLLAWLFVVWNAAVQNTYIYQCNTVFNKSINLQLSSFKVLNSSPGPNLINVQVEGTANVDLSSLHVWELLLYYPTLYILGSAIISNLKPIEVSAQLPFGSDKNTHFLEATVPDLSFDFTPGSTNHFSETVSLNITQEALKLLIDSFEDASLGETKLTLQTSINLSTTDGDVFKHIVVNIERPFYLELPQFYKHGGFLFEDIKINNGLITQDLYWFTGLENLKFNIEIPEIEWDIVTRGCDKDFIRIGSFVSESMEILPYGHTTTIPMTLTFSKLGRRATKYCENGISPINKFINNALSDVGDYITFVPKYKSSINENLPYVLLWSMSIILHKIQFKVQFPLENYFDNDIFTDFIIKDKTITLSDAEHELPRLSSHLDFELGYPSGINNQNNQLFNIHELTGYMTIQFEETPIFGINLHKWQNVETKNNRFSVDLEEARLHVLDVNKIKEIVEHYNDSNFANRIVVVNTRTDISVKSVIFDTVIQQLENHFILPLSSVFGTKLNSNVKFQDFTYLGTTTGDELRVVASFKVDNPFDFNIEFQYLNLEIYHENFNIGTIEFPQTYFTANKDSNNVDVYLKLKLPFECEARDLFNPRLLGQEPQIFVRGHSESSKMAEFNKLFDGTELKLPLSLFLPEEKLITKVNFYPKTRQIQFNVYNPFIYQPDLVSVHFNQINIKFPNSFENGEEQLSNINFNIDPAHSSSDKISVLGKPISKLLRKYQGIKTRVQMTFLFSIEIGNFKLHDLTLQQELPVEIF